MSRFRRAGPDDLEPLLALQREYYAAEAYPFVEAPAREALARLLETPALGAVWVATDGSEPAGYVVLTMGYSLEYRGVDAFVDELFVRPASRGRGLGRDAMGVVEAECLRRSVRALHLEVEPGKPDALALYRRFGFKEHGRRLMTRLIVESPAS